MTTRLPAGPRSPALLQTIAAWSRPIAYLERCRARYGPRFTGRPLGQPPFVILSRPEEVRELFVAPPETLHAGEGARLLEWLVGHRSVILLDEGAHLEQRKLLLSAFHSKNVQHLSGPMRELIEREVDSWPRGETVALHPKLRALTLEIILRTVFGLERGAELERVRELLVAALAVGESPLSLVPLPTTGLLAHHGPVARLRRRGTAADELIFNLIAKRRDAGAGGDDVLTLLLDTHHDDGTPMSPSEVRDELMTALVAGHETTASQLAWAFALLSREPAVIRRLQEEMESGSDDAYLTATIQEILRRRPVLPFAEPRLVMKPFELGGLTYPPGVVLIANPYLTHHDPATYPEPYAFRPERFLAEPPGTYTWIPFGGGVRRCVGAHFAMHEMKVVLRAVLERCQLRPAGERPEPARRRGVTISPARGGQVILLDRRPATAGHGGTATAGERPARRRSSHGDRSNEVQ
jgi:cytochrome P450